MAFTRRGRRRRALARPFPDAWRALLADMMVHWSMLDDEERQRLEDLIRILLVDKFWEASHGFQLTEEIRVVISAMAGLLIIGRDYDDYHGVTSIIVAPTTVVLSGERPLDGGLFSDEPERLVGMARSDGPVLIAWDAARDQARHPDRGHNVVYHEFAHKLDMLDGSADGAPPLESSAEHTRWVEVCNAEYTSLREGDDVTLLDPYGAVNPAEFFAVITEAFFNTPVQLKQQKPTLYGVLRDFYRQDPAWRERRARASAFNDA